MDRELKVASGWTVETSHAFLDNRIDESDRRYEQRFLTQEKAVSAALASATEAVRTRNEAMEKRFDSVNEFRGMVNDVLTKAVTRDEASAKHEALAVRLEGLEKMLDQANGVRAGGAEAKANLRANVATIIAIIMVLFALYSHIPALK